MTDAAPAKVPPREQATPHRPAECGATGKVSLREQADEAQRELAMRHRVYPGLVKRGKMSAAESAVSIDRMRAIRDTLRLFADHEDAVRAALAGSIRRKKEAAEVEALREHPAVQAVFDAFPDADIAEVRHLEGASSS